MTNKIGLLIERVSAYAECGNLDKVQEAAALLKAEYEAYADTKRNAAKLRKQRQRARKGDVTRDCTVTPSPPLSPSPSPPTPSSPSPPISPSPMWPALADRVVVHFNEVTGREYCTGKHRNKADAKNIIARLKEQHAYAVDNPLPEWPDPVERALVRVMCVADEKYKQTNETRPGGGTRFDIDWLKPSTLYRPSNFSNYLQEAQSRAARNGGMDWVVIPEFLKEDAA